MNGRYHLTSASQVCQVNVYFVAFTFKQVLWQRSDMQSGVCISRMPSLSHASVHALVGAGCKVVWSTRVTYPPLPWSYRPPPGRGPWPYEEATQTHGALRGSELANCSRRKAQWSRLARDCSLGHVVIELRTFAVVMMNYVCFSFRMSLLILMIF